jgi:hypothetical protein
VLLPDSVLECILGFIVTPNTVDRAAFASVIVTCQRLKALAGSKGLWRECPHVLASGELNTTALQILGLKGEGTEGLCFRAFSRPHQCHYAVKRARVFPDVSDHVLWIVALAYVTGRGSALLHDARTCCAQGSARSNSNLTCVDTVIQKLAHPRISALEQVSLHHSKLYLLFPYVDCTLQDFINPSGLMDCGVALLSQHVRL